MDIYQIYDMTSLMTLHDITPVRKLLVTKIFIIKITNWGTDEGSLRQYQIAKPILPWHGNTVVATDLWS